MEIGQTKPKEVPTDWEDANIKMANFNNRALNALFSVVMNEEFKKISSIKDSKLQRLTTSFEEIKMWEDESFDEFYAKLKDILNSAFNLGKAI